MGMAQDGRAEWLLRTCTESLSRLNASLWSRREAGYTLYTTRYQFAANAKAMSVLPAYVAALMGHAVDRTACCHYARRQRNEVFRPVPDGAWTISGVPRALPGEILRVREFEMVDLATMYRAPRRAPEPEPLSEDCPD